jgi:regulator of protease activity HflC (stomatin/prohibitin superfamily)
MKQRTNQFAPGLGVLLAAAVLLGAIGFMLHDFRELRYGPIGAFLWAGALLVAFTLGTIYLSRVLLPLPDDPGWSQSFRLLWQSYFTGGVADMTRWYDSAAIMATPDRPAVAPSFDLLRTGVLPAHEAVAIVRGNSYVRADGPGLIFLRPGESIAQVIDLRPQLRTQSLVVNTRDGIPLDTSVSVRFKVRSPAEPPEEESLREDQERQPYPYDPHAVFYLHYISTVAEGDVVRPWTEQVAPQAATLLVSALGQCSLDELTVSGGTDKVKAARDAIKLSLEEQFLPLGIEIMSVGVGSLQPPPEVMAQRLATWQIQWEAKSALERATGDAEATRLVRQARARAQIDIIENLVQSIESMRGQTNAELHEIIMMRILNIMEQAVSDESVQALIPGPLLSNLTADATQELRTSLDLGDE